MDAILFSNQGAKGENEHENDDAAALHAYQNVLPMISALIRCGSNSIKYDDTAENIFHTEGMRKYCTMIKECHANKAKTMFFACVLFSVKFMNICLKILSNF